MNWGRSLERFYTKYGEIKEERDYFGHVTKWEYDQYGRKKLFYLPDSSAISYAYTKNSLTTIRRCDKDLHTLYSHEYIKFDPNQHVEEEILPLGLGKTISGRDLLERPISLHSPFHRIELSFNGNHLVTQKKNSLTGDKDYAYDSLSQIIQEGDQTFAFDALGNSKEFEINEFNQILSSKEEIFSYDENGNLISRKGIKYQYDALDRLIKISYDTGKSIRYVYDCFSRLVAKEEEKTFYYLYDGSTEIGLLSQEAEILQLKVLGLGVKGDIGAAVAIELLGEVYVPLHDFQGNIIAIVSPAGEIVEKYCMNAFGEETNAKKKNNPWRFSSKRYEEGLYYYGMRFYDPLLKRWITPDPAGFVDSRNLYLFNLNSPLNRLDEFGLSSSSFYVSNPGCMRQKRNLTPYKQPHINPQVWVMPQFSSPLPYIGKATIDGKEMTVMMKFPNSYGHVFTETDMKRGYYDLFDDLAMVLTKVGDKATTSGFLIHNGMSNSKGDFLKMFSSVQKKIPKNSFAMGVYNESFGISDILRVGYGFVGGETAGMANLRAAQLCIFDLLEEYAPMSHFECIAHSEGALNHRNSFESMPTKQKQLYSKYLRVHTFGAPKPFPKNYGVHADNYYSTEDYATNGELGHIIGNAIPGKVGLTIRATTWLAIYLRDRNSTIISLPATTPYSERTAGFIDHGIMGSTYQKAIKDVIEESLDQRGGVYEYSSNR